MCERAPMFTREQVKVTMKARGWSYRRAANHLGRTYQHISYVLNGQRHSVALLRKLAELPATRREEKGAA